MSATNTKNKGELVQQHAKQWRLKSAVLAVAVLAGGISVSAQALVLGQIQIESSIGEPVKAKIPVTKLTSDEASSLVIKLSSGDDFKGRGLIYNPAISAMRVSFAPTGNSTGVITVVGMKPVQDPFVDLLLDVTWRTGSMQRSYTMLFDPPEEVMQNAQYSSSEKAQSNVTNLPTSSSTQVVQGESVTGVPVSTERQADGTVYTRIGASRPSDINEPQNIKGGSDKPEAGSGNKASGKSAQSTPPREPAQSSYSSEFAVTVSKGQTLGKIANSMKPAGVSQEQMLIALFRANPHAFINGNINWLRSGVTLNVPSESEIAQISQQEARKEVSKHAKKFNEQRHGIADSGVNTVPPKKDNVPADRTTGQVSTDPVPQSNVGQPDLTISPGNAEQLERDERLAQEAQTDYAETHIAEVKQAQSDLEKAKQEADALAASNAVSGNVITDTVTNELENSSSTPSSSEPVIDTVSIDTVSQEPDGTVNTIDIVDVTEGSMPDRLVDETNPAEVASENNQTVVEATVVDESSAVTETTPPVVENNQPTNNNESFQPTPTEKSLVEELLENPLIPIGGLVGVILIVFVLLKVLRRKKKDDFMDDSTMGDSLSGEDSFFSDNADDSSMLDQSSSIYAASQLDTNADVDPLQEADVYLAYGRDEQAAEILRDAIQVEPDRSALRVKLCEIYAKQGDQTQFSAQVNQLRQMTGGSGEDWERVEKLMQEMNAQGDTVQPSTAGAPVQPTGFSANFAPPSAQAPASSKEASGASSILPDLEMSDISFDVPGSAGSSAFSTSPSLSMDPASEIPDDEEGPSTRLALAEEFLAIGNKGDAKEIVEEVLAEDLSTDLKDRAQNLLNKASS